MFSTGAQHARASDIPDGNKSGYNTPIDFLERQLQIPPPSLPPPPGPHLLLHPRTRLLCGGFFPLLSVPLPFIFFSPNVLFRFCLISLFQLEK